VQTAVRKALMPTERYRDILVAAKRHAINCGVDVNLDYTPALENEPYVLSYSTAPGEQRRGVILVFPPTDLFLSSNEIAFIIDQIKNMENEGGQTLLVFSEETLARITNVLKASGITNHASASSYKRASGSYEMDWSVP
jgi:hypothetical protein